jgi:hypothetical protein
MCASSGLAGIPISFRVRRTSASQRGRSNGNTSFNMMQTDHPEYRAAGDAQDLALIAQNVVVTLINCLGIYRWLVWKGKGTLPG